ncbi:hypothetical protein [Salinisphaera sp. LB1]|nr:hypothetical protein [Salinisphaera sp. LB1]AWN14914.1 hypothetical protein SALB1_0707 [Salinisphaera sp. LB1]
MPRRSPGATSDRPHAQLLMLALIGLPLVPFGIAHAFQSLVR